MRYNLYDLSTIPLSGYLLSIIAEDAWTAAGKPGSKISDCPWDRSRGRTSKYKRVVWRSVYRHTREARTDLVTRINAMAGQEIAA